MPRFLAGLILGGISAGLTYAASTDPQLAALIGAIAAILTWCGILTLIIGDLD
ncbi:hypothetical protein [Streptomyces virginiae]